MPSVQLSAGCLVLAPFRTLSHHQPLAMYVSVCVCVQSVLVQEYQDSNPWYMKEFQASDPDSIMIGMLTNGLVMGAIFGVVFGLITAGLQYMLGTTPKPGPAANLKQDQPELKE